MEGGHTGVIAGACTQVGQKGYKDGVAGVASMRVLADVIPELPQHCLATETAAAPACGRPGLVGWGRGNWRLHGIDRGVEGQTGMGEGRRGCSYRIPKSRVRGVGGWGAGKSAGGMWLIREMPVGLCGLFEGWGRLSAHQLRPSAPPFPLDIKKRRPQNGWQLFRCSPKLRENVAYIACEHVSMQHTCHV